MRAIVVREFGGPEVLRIEEVPDPVPGAGELLVRVVAAGIQFVETQARTGALQGVSPVAPKSLPWIPGREVAGDVIAVGAGVAPDWVGRRVLGLTVPVNGGPGGGYAELAVVQAENSHQLPDTLDYADAVSLLGTGRTALALIEQSEVGKGDTVLVEGATGAVGVLSMQLAHAAGAERVIALVRGAEKLKLAKDFGADVAIDTSADDWPAQVRAAAPEGVTVVLDGVGGELGATTFDLVARGGRFVIFGFSSGAMTKVDPDHAAERGVSVLSYFGPPTGPRSPEVLQRQSRDVLAAVADGTLRTLVGARYPLDQAAQAHAAIAARRTSGKTVLEP
ncbi:zinc-binding dehydrogenase [Actinospica sp. MGRD01-02]|uniref:Zinc-binding dehydrogenase n=1 Tax=Actinospica acidithermotolerans TaxID=2828514 RepID=A0A941ECL4_9ACTN|nr:zinc-binding dehydrogenase [Actinospica acidithermotolerans]MBR7827905.1 zinc-binding dehydrogenase [Actinospica acidithermotolerans]